MHTRDESTKVTSSDPLLNASIPRLPLPANRSRTHVPVRSKGRVENIACFTRSVVGLTPLAGHSIRLEPYLPAQILIDIRD
ncbi:MAG TPA: hypothetical protein PLA83_01790 [Deltaproteobacteria bacterium]|nr:hypothetical protein [Deltaproteobacteria bacterium]HQI01214.1 hypothetical protein [Deltaproteobacteria bacterium]